MTLQSGSGILAVSGTFSAVLSTGELTELEAVGQVRLRHAIMDPNSEDFVFLMSHLGGEVV